jgi:hypothetical protein
VPVYDLPAIDTFLSLVNGWPGAEIDALNQTQFLQFDRAANEAVTC